MSARSVPEELVQAAAEALNMLPVSLHGWRYRAAEDCLAHTREQMAALVASVEVREGLVRAANATEGWAEPKHPAGPAIRVWPLVDAMLDGGAQ